MRTLLLIALSIIAPLAAAILGSPWVAKGQAMADTSAAFFVEAREVPPLLVGRSPSQRVFRSVSERSPDLGSVSRVAATSIER